MEPKSQQPKEPSIADIIPELEQQRRILEDHAKKIAGRGENTRSERKYSTKDLFVYPGNVQSDIKAVEYFAKHNKAHQTQNATNGFKMVYGQLLGVVRDVIAQAPREIRGILDMRGTLAMMLMWQREYPYESEEWTQVCDKIVNEWLNGIKYSASDKAKEEYVRLRQLMDHVNYLRRQGEEGKNS
ncbi:hypothetical protein TSTA_057990 [Talaromyces stipitatus ATCC 10500]|uniref:Uncharacterized protein n=1 Tax=Talaromyces stipitatus (strain ATCC 10500 / CBS 375.48 / QM 6759 / NRRL 1006) TaxID=441959 RepID=B8MRX7_TALSN|nr:uncharacterized protein TSTA_057990 [Talaromyces stipitatus ATCC 10500]EED13310.1 hypothetical protein TSTA_057990 [Talaromyces stipitatus ATCC 10500]